MRPIEEINKEIAETRSRLSALMLEREKTKHLTRKTAYNREQRERIIAKFAKNFSKPFRISDIQRRFPQIKEWEIDDARRGNIYENTGAIYKLDKDLYCYVSLEEHWTLMDKYGPEFFLIEDKIGPFLKEKYGLD